MAPGPIEVVTPRPDLPALFAGGPILVAAGIPLPPHPLGEAGPEAWSASPAGAGRVCLHRSGTPPETDPVPLPAAPGDVLAIVAAEAATGQALAAWWEREGARRPRMIVAAGLGAALPDLAAALAAGLQDSAAHAAALQRALVESRRENEELREAMADLLRTLGQAVPKPMRLLLAAAPTLDGRIVAPAPLEAPLRQTLGLALPGLCAVAVHLARAEAGPDTQLRIRLVGAESGRVVGAWTVPGPALAPGWLVLDLPAPAGPLRETATLLVGATLGPGAVLALSLAEGRDEATALRGAAASPGEATLAIRAWGTEPGGRFVQAAHWDWTAVGAALAPDGMRLALPDAVLAGAALAGSGASFAGPRPRGEPLRLVLTDGAASVLRLPGLPLDDAEAVLVTLSPVDPGAEPGTPPVRISLALEPGAVPRNAPPAEPGAAAVAIGWRMPEDTGPTTLALAVPAWFPRTGTLVLRLEAGRRATPALVTLAALEVVRRAAPPRPEPAAGPAEDPVAAPALAPSPAEDPEAASPAAPQRLVPLAEGAPPGVILEGVAVDGHQDDGRVRLVDLRLVGFRHPGGLLPEAKFKMIVTDGTTMLEFRRGPGWPEMFRAWPGRRSDAFGPLFQMTAWAERSIGFGLVRDPVDRAFLEALLQSLAWIIRSAGPGLPGGSEASEFLAAAAARFAARFLPGDAAAPVPAAPEGPKQDTPAEPPPLATIEPPPETPPPIALPTGIRLARLVVQAEHRTETLRALELWMEGFAFPDGEVAAAKFKFLVSGQDTLLEFRRGEGWPEAFRRWPGRRSDQYGPVYRVIVGAERNFGLELAEDPVDAAFLQALVGAFPAMLAAVAPPTPGGIDWPAAAGRFAERLGAVPAGA